ncbi:hypothetical protein [Bordetella trematum]|uniref:hypothetical protein n=1 Tax=Bordetella trematum TaxID=123899 RepID=UPI000472E91D|nr:hypothetical protein [Bordetella trematum]
MLRAMDIEINEELRTYIDPLTPDEFAALEQSILAEGCRDALVLWGNVLVDGHNRYEICTRHGLEFRTMQNPRFRSFDDVRLWMIDNHLGRRSVSDYQRGVLALRKKQILQMREAPPEGEARASSAEPVAVPTRQELAREARLSSNTLAQIERIEQRAVPELVHAVRSGDISINAAAAVASLPQERQQAAAQGGKQNLREAARQAREALQAARYAAQLRKQAEAQEQAAQAGQTPPDAAVPPWEDAPVEDYPAEVRRLNGVIVRLTEERDTLKKKVMQLSIALAEARRGDA